MNLDKNKLCILVSNDVSHDPRIVKQANSGADNGYNTLVLGWTFEVRPTAGFKETKKDGWTLRVGFRNILKGSLLRLRLRCIAYNWFIIVIRAKDYFPRVMSIARFFYAVINKVFSIINNYLTENETNNERIEEEALESNQSESYQVTSLPSGDGIWQKFLNKFFEYRFLFHYYRSLNQFLIKQAIDFQPNIIHANDLDTLFAGYLIKRRTKAKLVYDAHEIWTRQGLGIPKLFLWLFALVEFLILRKVDAFISVNQSIIDVIEKINCCQLKVPKEVIYNCPKYSKPFANKKSTRTIEVLYQGRYSPNRGLEELAESCRYLEKGSTVIFRGVGDKDSIKKIITRGNSINARFDSPVAMKNLVKQASLSDVGIVPYKPVNINNQLCLPNKVFEYMMAGLALIVSDLPELRELVNKYHNGLLIDPNNPKSIAKAINRLNKDRKLLKRMQQNSLKAAKELNWEEQEKKLLAVYLA